MKFQKVNAEHNLDCVSLYEDRSITELKSIQPKWAYGMNVDKLLDYIQNPKHEEYSIFLVDPNELIANAELLEVTTNKLFTGEANNDYRIARILYRWENGYFVDPPSIGISSPLAKKLTFTDGRHRTKLCYFLGHKQIPIAIGNFEIQQISTIIKLTST